MQYCGIALIGFDADYYPSKGSKGVADQIAAAAREGLENIKKNIGNRLKEEKLDQIEIEMLCIPLPSAEGFRDAFLKAMGLSKPEAAKAAE